MRAATTVRKLRAYSNSSSSSAKDATGSSQPTAGLTDSTQRSAWAKHCSGEPSPTRSDHPDASPAMRLACVSCGAAMAYVRGYGSPGSDSARRLRERRGAAAAAGVAGSRLTDAGGHRGLFLMAGHTPRRGSDLKRRWHRRGVRKWRGHASLLRVRSDSCRQISRGESRDSAPQQPPGWSWSGECTSPAPSKPSKVAHTSTAMSHMSLIGWAAMPPCELWIQPCPLQLGLVRALHRRERVARLQILVGERGHHARGGEEQHAQIHLSVSK